MATIHCKLCDRPLPEGEEHPEYFGQVSTWEPGNEAEWVGEDVGQLLNYAHTINEAVQEREVTTTPERTALPPHNMRRGGYVEEISLPVVRTSRALQPT
jgi:hypothetical protein